MSADKKMSDAHETVSDSIQSAAQVVPPKKMSSKLFLPIFSVVVGAVVLTLFFGKLLSMLILIVPLSELPETFKFGFPKFKLISSILCLNKNF